MATFITLVNFTDQGIKNIKESPKRANAFQDLAKKSGCTVKEVYWTQGQYDLITVVEAPDEQTMSALILSVAGAGNVRGQTLRAFNAAEFGAILKKMG
jgi:uncharacterized protein with GYD domain